MSSTFTPSTDELVGRNATYAADFGLHDLPSEPSRNLAVVTCMDARIHVRAVLGLGDGEAHIIRNAGGVITDDVIRSLCLSQRTLGTREIIVMHHTGCGLQNLDETAFLSELETDVGVAPHWSPESFADAYDDVRRSMQRLMATPFVQHTEHLRGFVYDVADGTLHAVSP